MPRFVRPLWSSLSLFRFILIGRLLFAATARSQEGSLDSSFLSPLFDAPVYGIAVEADGRILCVYTTNSTRFAISRLSANGSLEAPLNLGDGPESITPPIDVGTTHIPGATNAATITEIRPLPNGQFLVGGTFSHFNKVARKLLVRLNQDGTVDPTFNAANGFVGNDISNIRLVSGNRLYVSGKFTKFGASSRNVGLVRLNGDGTLDTSFADSTISFGANVIGFSLQTDGKPVVNAAYANAAFQATFQVYRLGANGGNDTTFTQGAGTPVGSTTLAHALLNNGQILVSGGGATYNGAAVNNALFRLNADGTLDGSFPGVTLKLSNTGGLIGRFLPAPNGTIYFSGAYDAVNGQARHGLARLLADGTLDPAFAPAVYVSPSPKALDLQPDGKILACASALTRSPGKFEVVRLNGAGTPPALGPTLGRLTFLPGNTNQILVTGAYTTVVVESSSDLKTWAPISTNTVDAGAIRFSDLPRLDFLSHYYRLLGVP